MLGADQTVSLHFHVAAQESYWHRLVLQSLGRTTTGGHTGWLGSPCWSADISINQGTSAGIRALRREPGQGWFSHAVALLVWLPRSPTLSSLSFSGIWRNLRTFPTSLSPAFPGSRKTTVRVPLGAAAAQRSILQGPNVRKAPCLLCMRHTLLRARKEYPLYSYEE